MQKNHFCKVVVSYIEELLHFRVRITSFAREIWIVHNVTFPKYFFLGIFFLKFCSTSFNCRFIYLLVFSHYFHCHILLFMFAIAAATILLYMQPR